MPTIVADLIARELKKNKITNIFMLTGYGAMYLNDSIQKAGINYFASRNEAAAPMMAEAYAKASGKIGAVCVTAGPGATNALPGLAEAYVDSAPIIIISGQVEKKFSADYYKKLNIRTLGTAEFSITRTLKQLTKYCSTIKNPKDVLYETQKALHLAKSGRPGPVWIEVPLDIQSAKILKPNNLKKYKPKVTNNISNNKKINILLKKIQSAKKPIFIIGNGLKQSGQAQEFIKIAKRLGIPFFSSRFANDLYPFSNKLNLGLLGVKGLLHGKKVTDECDLLISMGCRFAPTLCLGNPRNFAKKAFTVSINNDSDELNLNLKKINLKLNSDLKEFFRIFKKKLPKSKKINFYDWVKYCNDQKKKYEIKNFFSKKNPIDLYRFMFLLDKLANKNNILITDAGSNYYIGGQAWRFENGQTEISSTANAAMGLSVPLSIGAAISNRKKQVLSVTGDGSIELNIQELKTISHYKLNIKTFVINNGGYVSMKKWQDNFFDGNRLDTKQATGVGTLNFKNIAKAFDLKYESIKKENEINKKIKKIISNNRPYLIEVFTDNNQKIYGKEF
jgi:acetolactate synthase I/II/III large subunit